MDDPRSPSSRSTASRVFSAAVLAAVMVAVTALAVYKVRIAIAVGPGWDTYAFLANAADFAGKGFGYIEPHRAPLISALTALIFRFTDLDPATIQWVDGALSVSGFAAFYLLLRRRFEPLLCAAGTLALVAVQPLWEYVGVGYTDFASVALSLWLLLALVKAAEEHPAWYLVAGPLFTAAALMRYTALLFVFPALVWTLLRWRPFRQARWIAGGAIAAIAAYLPAAAHYMEDFGDALFPFLVAFAFSENVAVPSGEVPAQAAGGWYLQQMPAFLSPDPLRVIALLILLVGGLGLMRKIGEHLGSAAPGVKRAALAVAGIAIGVLPQFGAGLVARQVAIPVAVFVVWRALAPREPAEEPSAGPARVTAASALDAAFLAFLLAYLDFHGHQTIQVPRYFITMAPSVLYFALLGWREWGCELDRLRTTLAREDADRTSARLAVSVVIAVASVALALGTAAATPSEPDPFVTGARDSAFELDAREADVSSATVYSDLWPLTSWYLGTDVRPMPSFEDTRAYAHELEKSSAEYFFTIRGRRFATFEEAHRTGPVVLLERTEPARDALPSVLYLGKSWDNYLEQLVGFDFFMRSTAGRYGWEGSAFLDAHTPAELARHDAVAAYGWRWRDRATGEDALLDYVSEGGTLVVDASRNLDGLAYSVAGTIMFDTFVRPAVAPRDGVIEVAHELAERYPELAAIQASPFVAEDGGVWAGATYEARPGTPPLETLATIDGQPAVQMRRIGEGAVYFVGYNLVWHAFSTENAGEAALIRAVFLEAIER